MIFSFFWVIALNRVVLYRFIPDQSKRRSTPNWCFCHAANWKCLYVVKGFCLFLAKAHPHESETEKYIQREREWLLLREQHRTAGRFSLHYLHIVKSCTKRVSAVKTYPLSRYQKKTIEKDYFTICWHLGRCRGVNN